jgi:hypothetical protein
MTKAGGTKVEEGLGGHSYISPNTIPIVALEILSPSQRSIDVGWLDTSVV